MLDDFVARKKFTPTSKPGQRTNPLNERFVNKTFTIPPQREGPKLKRNTRYTEDIDLDDALEDEEYDDLKLESVSVKNALKEENNELKKRLSNYETEFTKLVEEATRLREENRQLEHRQEEKLDFEHLDNILTPYEIKLLAKVHIIKNSKDVSVAREMMKYYEQE